MSDWKPGDVAMVTCSDGIERRAMCSGRGLVWRFGDGMVRLIQESEARPLVVIDIEDGDAMDRLSDVLDYGVIGLRDALREYATPTPPKPEEPQGLGAVVEDADGKRWVRSQWYALDETPWVNAGDNGWKAWAELKVVRVLSEGVS